MHDIQLLRMSARKSNSHNCVNLEENEATVRNSCLYSDPLIDRHLDINDKW